MRTTSSWWLLSMAEVFRRRGLPVARLFAQAGLSLQSLAHAHTRYPQDGVTRLWEAAAAASGDDQIGLAVGQQVRLTGFPVLAHAIITASGLLEGFRRFQRYQRMIGESADIRLVPRGDRLMLEFHFSGDELPVSIHTVDAAMAAVMNLASLLEGEQWRPEEVHLCRAMPRSARAFEDCFQCPVYFSEPRNSLQLPAEFLAGINQSPVGQAPSLWEPAVPGAEKPVSELVAMLLGSKLQDGGLSKPQVARQLNVTPRTLQRRLAREGETFQAILDRVRLGKAREALANPLLLPVEIAFLCGFSDVTAFHHAFRRWQGQTPGQYRSSILNQLESQESV